MQLQRLPRDQETANGDGSRGRVFLSLEWLSFAPVPGFMSQTCEDAPASSPLPLPSPNHPHRRGIMHPACRAVRGSGSPKLRVERCRSCADRSEDMCRACRPRQTWQGNAGSGGRKQIPGRFWHGSARQEVAYGVSRARAAVGPHGARARRTDRGGQAGLGSQERGVQRTQQRRSTQIRVHRRLPRA